MLIDKILFNFLYLRKVGSETYPDFQKVRIRIRIFKTRILNPGAGGLGQLEMKKSLIQSTRCKNLSREEDWAGYPVTG